MVLKKKYDVSKYCINFLVYRVPINVCIHSFTQFLGKTIVMSYATKHVTIHEKKDCIIK